MSSVESIAFVAVVALGIVFGLVLHYCNHRSEQRRTRAFANKLRDTDSIRVEGFSSALSNPVHPSAAPDVERESAFGTRLAPGPIVTDLRAQPRVTAAVNSKAHVAAGTRLHACVGWTMMVAVLLLGGAYVAFITLVPTFGLGLVGWILGGLLYVWHLRKARARLRGSAVLVSAAQFPRIHAAVEGMAERLGLTDKPEVYIVEANVLNASAWKQAGRSCVVLSDDIVHGALATGNSNILNFIIGHELAHHALGHTGFFRSIISAQYLPLSRLDEFSCDAVAHALVADATAARDALILLLVGPQLFHELNRTALEEQTTKVIADRYTQRSERGLSHPLLLRRYARLRNSSAAS